MAKTKAKPKGRPPGGGKGRMHKLAVQVRCNAPWRDYLHRFAEARGTDVADLIEEAIRLHASFVRFESPPKRGES